MVNNKKAAGANNIRLNRKHGRFCTLDKALSITELWLTPATKSPTLSMHPSGAGIGTPRTGKHKRYPLVAWAVYGRALRSMVGDVEQPLERLAGTCAGSSNLTSSAAQRLEPLAGGLSFYTGATQ